MEGRFGREIQFPMTSYSDSPYVQGVQNSFTFSVRKVSRTGGQQKLS